MKHRIYYSKPEHFRDFILGDVHPQRAALDKTHTFLIDHIADDLESVYKALQAEAWSPNGEAAALIREKGLGHTSMSVGDVIEDEDGTFWAVAPVGFVELI